MMTLSYTDYQKCDFRVTHGNMENNLRVKVKEIMVACMLARRETTGFPLKSQVKKHAPARKFAALATTSATMHSFPNSLLCMRFIQTYNWSVRKQ